MKTDIPENELRKHFNVGMTSTILFQINEKMVVEFSQLTGDCNPLHLSQGFARKSMFRQQIVQGMLLVAFTSALDFLHLEGYTSIPIHLSGQFIEPAYVGDQLSLEGKIRDVDEKGGLVEVTYSVRKGEKDVVAVKGSMEVKYVDTKRDREDGSHVYEPHHQATMAVVPLKLRELTLEEISVKDREEFNFMISENSISALMEILSEGNLEKDKISFLAKMTKFGYPNLLAMMLFSTSVGMCIPGKHATFLSFNAEVNKFFKKDVLYRLKSEVTHVSSSTRIIKNDILIDQPESENGTCLRGKVSILVNPSPAEVPSIHELKESALDLRLEGKVVLVTGASRGIGETTAKLFSLYGAQVIINYFRGEEDAKRIANEIEEEGGKVVAVHADVTDPKQVQGMIKRVVEKFRRIDVLVNNAVKDFKPIEFSTLTWEDIQKDVDVIVRGAFNCCKEVIPLMSKQGGGKIINIGTVATDNPPPKQIKYVVAKSALVGLTRSLSIEFAKENIQINMVVPSFVETDLVSYIPEVYRKKIALETPMQRNASPIDVAKAVIFLASAYSSFTTGQKIMVTGGGVPYL